MKIAAYLRVSTDDQKTDLQRDAIASYAAFKQWENVTLFIDKGESGSKESRPELDKMMNQVRAKKFDVVLVWKLDRLGRSTIHLLQLVDELKTLSVDFVSITEQLDTSSPMGKMIFGIFAVLAQFEREQLVMRTNAGIKAAKQRGVKFGAKSALDNMENVLELNDCINKGMDAEEIADHFKIDRATAYRWIKKNNEKKEA